MRHKALILAMVATVPAHSASEQTLQQKIQLLQRQTQTLQSEIKHLQNQISDKKNVTNKTSSDSVPVRQISGTTVPAGLGYHSSSLMVNAPDTHPESFGFYPTALLADNHVVTYIAGTPIVTSPYLGERPAFDGSDYIVNISSINRDIRLMQQRRQLYSTYEKLGYPLPQMPIISLSGAVEPSAQVGNSFRDHTTGDLTLGTNELDVAAILNAEVEAFMSIAYDSSPPTNSGQRIANSAFSLNQGFVNIGNLDKTPFYLTAGQLLVPFGRYSSAMISSPLTQVLARTKARPVILGYKSQAKTGPFAAIYGFKSDTLLGTSGVGGVNLGYVFNFEQYDLSGEIGGGYIASIADSQGMQSTDSSPFTTFGGFASITNGSEFIHKVPGGNVHGNISFDRFSLNTEWVGATEAFKVQDLSFNGRGAKPQAEQIEAGVTFMVWNKPSSLNIGYQWTQQALALNLPRQRGNIVFNISILKDTLLSLEYRHDRDYKCGQYANGIAPPGLYNENTLATGSTANTVLGQIGVYF